MKTIKFAVVALVAMMFVACNCNTNEKTNVADTTELSLDAVDTAIDTTSTEVDTAKVIDEIGATSI